MAKGHALFGKIKGRLGGAVYRVQDGKQIISELAITHFNPKSQAQIEQRVRFGLATLVSKQFSYAAIAGWSPKPNVARAALLRSLMKGVVIDATDPDNPKATIDPTRVLISNGRFIPVNSVRIAQGSTSSKVSVKFSVPEGSNVTYALVVVLMSSGEGTEWNGAAQAVASRVGDTQSFEAEVDAGVTLSLSGITFNTFVVPICDSTNYVSTVYGSVLTLADANAFATEVAIALSKRDYYCQSVFVGSARF